MFDASVIWMAALAEIALPVRTIRLTDGGTINWAGVGLFTPKDDEFGVIGSVEQAEESLGDEAPGGQFTILCPTETAMVSLASPANQGALIKFWIAETNASGVVIGTPELQFVGTIDTLQVELDRGRYEVTIEYMSEAERLFGVREGNVLSPRFHQTAWPGELGFDYCIGVGKQVPWGVSGMLRGSSSYSGSSGGGGRNPIGRAQVN